LFAIFKRAIYVWGPFSVSTIADELWKIPDINFSKYPLSILLGVN